MMFAKLLTLSNMICYCLREIVMGTYDSEKWSTAMIKGDPEK